MKKADINAMALEIVAAADEHPSGEDLLQKLHVILEQLDAAYASADFDEETTLVGKLSRAIKRLGHLEVE